MKMVFLNFLKMLSAIGLVMSFIALVSCGNNNRACQRIEVVLNNQNKSEKGLNQLYQLAKRNLDCLDDFTDVQMLKNGDELDSTKLARFYFGEAIVETPDFKVNVFLENSGSMWGYFKGSTDCETVLSRLLVLSNFLYKKEKAQLSFITDEIIKQNISAEVTDFIARLEPGHLKVGNYRNTKIADILKTVINNTDEDELSILISDCIYSSGRNQESASFEWSLIEEAFLNALEKNNTAVAINKYTSNFKGKYYELDSNTGKETEVKYGFRSRFERPYYVILIGDENIVNEATKGLDFGSFKGYKDSYLICSPSASQNINYRIVNFFKKGSFKPDRKNRKRGIKKARKAKRGPDKGMFQYTIAANLNSVKTSSSYLLDSSKYEVNSDYKLSIVEVDDTMKQKYPVLASYTHLLSLSCQSDLREEEISISLLRTTPQWVEDTHTEDDKDQSEVGQQKTRGFKYLVKGIERAFDRANKQRIGNEYSKFYFTLKTKIKL